MKLPFFLIYSLFFQGQHIPNQVFQILLISNVCSSATSRVYAMKKNKNILMNKQKINHRHTSKHKKSEINISKTVLGPKLHNYNKQNINPDKSNPVDFFYLLQVGSFDRTFVRDLNLVLLTGSLINDRQRALQVRRRLDRRLSCGNRRRFEN